jgi:HlyD family secretion protein
MSGFLKRNRYVFIVLVIVAVAVGGWLYTRRNAQNADAAFQTSTIQRGNLIATIGATGTVRAKQTVNLTWQTNGMVDVVNVKVGDNVPAGYVMAYLKKTSLSQNIILAEADLASAQKALDELLNSETALAQAQQKLVLAQEALEDAQKDVTKLDYRRASDDLIDQTKNEIILAKQQVSRAEDFYNLFRDRPDGDSQKAQAELNLINARTNRDQKIATLDWYLGTPSELDAAKYRAALALAEAQLEDAQREFDRLSAGNKVEIESAQARVDAAQATLNLANITSPFGGIVTEAYPLSGDQASAGAKAFRIDDLSVLLVDVEVSEVDINSVSVGQKAVLSFDAILGRNYDGVVVEVAKVGTVSGNLVNFKVTIQLTNPDDFVKPGMTAAVDITVNELQDVILIPNRSVRSIEGVRYVYILEGGAPVRKRVQIISSANQQSAITAGEVEVGDEVILNPPAEFGGPGGGGPGGGFGN